jgi:hypothetical protein
MAEVFGAVAGAIGVVGVAGQLLEGIKSIRGFCKDMKSAPSFISDLSQELATFQSILDTIPFSLGAATQYNDAALEMAIRQCIVIVARLESMVRLSDLQGLPQDERRRRKQIRLAFNKKDFSDELSRLHGAKLNLLAAIQYYNM